MKFLALGFLVLAFNAFAVESKICVITTDVDAEKTDFYIETDSKGDLDTIRLVKTFGRDFVSDEYLPVERVIEEGMVASKREGRDIVIIKAKTFNPSKGGVVTLNILTNAIKNSRMNYNLNLNRVGDKFVLTGPEGQKVNRLHMLGNKILGQVVGLKEVKASYVPNK